MIVVLHVSKLHIEKFQMMLFDLLFKRGRMLLMPPKAMKTLSWNCRGLGNPRGPTIRALEELCTQQDPTLVFFMETRREDHEMNTLRGMSGLNNLISHSCTGKGRSGGLALLWKDDIELSLLSTSKNYIDFIVTMEEGSKIWRGTGIYGYPELKMKQKTCELLPDLANRDRHLSANWLVFGDFNQVLAEDEKRGGVKPKLPLMTLFRESLQFCSLHDLGFEGNNKYTWCNNQEGEKAILERLDRFVATSSWSSMFPQAKVFHLTMDTSDHMAILVECGEVVKNEPVRNHDDPYDKANSCLNRLIKWTKRRFGDVTRKIFKMFREKNLKKEWLQ